MTTMNSLRTTLVALVTLAIAAFPLAGASAQSVSSEPAQVMSQADCENHAQNVQAKSHQTKVDHGRGHCGKAGGCGKCLCLGMMAVLAPAPGVAPSPKFTVKTVRITDSLVSHAYIPPSPPPRV